MANLATTAKAECASMPLVDLKDARVAELVARSLSQGVILPAKQTHESTLIFLHGLGDRGASWAAGLADFQRQLPNTAVITPTARTLRVTCNSGAAMPAWHDIVHFDDINDESDPREGLDDSIAIVRGVIQQQLDQGIPASKIVLGGFSQGAALSLLVAYSLPVRLGGVVALSGYGLRTDQTAVSAKDSDRPRGFVAHGLLDDVVPHASGEAIVNTLRDSGVDIDFRTYPNLAHSASPKELQDMLEFVKTALE